MTKRRGIRKQVKNLEMHLVSSPWIKPVHLEGLTLSHHLGKSLSIPEVGNLWQTPENPQFQASNGMEIWWPDLSFEKENGKVRTITLELDCCGVY